MRLYDVTIGRVHSDGSRDWDSTFPMWAAVEDDVRARWPYVGRDYRDELVALREVPPDELEERRDKAALHPERCCELAVLRPCVCRVSFTCPTHGTNCHGTHD